MCPFEDSDVASVPACILAQLVSCNNEATLVNWSRATQGVLIEPSPSNYRMLARNRPRALALNLAICNSDTAVHFVDARETSGVYEYMAPSFVKRWHRKVRTRGRRRALAEHLQVFLAVPAASQHMQCRRGVLGRRGRTRLESLFSM